MTQSKVRLDLGLKSFLLILLSNVLIMSVSITLLSLYQSNRIEMQMDFIDKTAHTLQQTHPDIKPEETDLLILELTETLRRNSNRNLLIVIISVSATTVLSAFVAYLIIHSITSRIAKVSTVAKHIGEGEYSARIELTGNDELTDLSSTVNAMAEAVMSRENRIRIEMDRFFKIFHTMNVGNIIVRTDSRTVIDINKQAASILGIGREDLIGKRCCDNYCNYAACNEGRCPYLDDGKLVDKNEQLLKNNRGEFVHIIKTIVPIELNGQSCLLESFIDITQRKQAEAKLLESEEKYRTLFETMALGVIYQDATGKIISANPAAIRILGRSLEQLQGRASDDPRWAAIHEDGSSFQPDQHPAMVALRTGEKIHNVVMGLASPVRNERVWISIDAIPQFKSNEFSPYQVYTVFNDITEQRNLEAQLRRTQRLESIGTLASGIAHDLNNVLTPILMTIDLLKMKLTDPKIQQFLTAVESSATRGSEIVKQVLHFARGTEREFAPQQLRYIIKEIRPIINETFPKNISIHVTMPDALPLISGDATQLHQILMNLCVNARDAMPDGGQLTISAFEEEIDESMARTIVNAKPGSYVCLSVQDTGAGIPPEYYDKIFVPFFTTKEIGKGTGLGLSTVYSIVKSHKGYVTFQSEVGKGTSFTLYFPSLSETTDPSTGLLLSHIQQGNGETILVIDDEPSIVSVTREVLSSYDYVVITAKDGTDAIIEMSKAGPGRIQLAVCDINMPSVGGLEIIKTLHRLDPKIKVIIASGLPLQSDAPMLRDVKFDRYIQKPYKIEKLLSTIHSVLAGTEYS
jgi:PAS domain S-box-containing protein